MRYRQHYEIKIEIVIISAFKLEEKIYEETFFFCTMKNPPMLPQTNVVPLMFKASGIFVCVWILFEMDHFRSVDLVIIHLSVLK